jgi:hypothetical protein
MEAWRKRSEDRMMDAATAVRMSQEARAAACVEVQVRAAIKFHVV